MENVMQATVIGARRFDIDGNKIGTMFISQPVDEAENDYVGHEVMKVSCPFNLIDEIRFQKLPGDFTMRVKMKTATGGKVGLAVLGLEALETSKKKN